VGNVVTGIVTQYAVSAYRLVLLVGPWRCGDKAAAVLEVVVVCGDVEAVMGPTMDITDMIQELGVAEAHKQCVTVCVCVTAVPHKLMATQVNLVESLTVQMVHVCV
jgi:hypothetical protein